MSSLWKQFSKLNARKGGSLKNSIPYSELTVDLLPCSCGHCRSSSTVSLIRRDSVSRCVQDSRTPMLPDIVQDAVVRERRPLGNRSSLDHQEHFVLILAGDINLGNELSDQVRDLAQTLRKYQIPYVIVTSTSEQPITCLTEAQCRTLPALQSDKSSVSAFVTACYKKAKKILIAVSPGYVLYADEYVHGAQRTESTMQEIIRRLHEQMKTERSRSSTHRLWPLLLHQLRTNRTHIPNFLSSVLFYWFGRKNVENVAVVLHRELQVEAHQN